ncbi:ATP-dependent DNA ligase [Tsukamurella strandjordii]|uniref:DNA ligase (ATP) n=1 Tax=Tsukamurella strandjordii TaxID=147577 RepID=A0AA90NJ14_9ACTN|nr:ATP-dependent DNA ligase [Tsukamurella strandjordii]MDP0399943.1 ATP-dependent DNA ligase [Tsukamurella strandjordii]
MAQTRENREVDGVNVQLTNLDKVLYPATGTTKSEVIDYYQAIAPFAVPHLRDRPLTRKRWPNGVDKTAFFEKRLPSHAPAWIRRGAQHHSDGESLYPVVENTADMVWLGQQAALELHVPQWTFVIDGETEVPGPPDRLVLDLDPGPGITLDDCAALALRIRDLLAAMGLDGHPVTSGSKGMHIYSTLPDGLSSPGARKVAHAIASQLETESPDLVTASMSKDQRGGRIFVDWSQNSGSKTTVSPYSLRGRDHPWVAAPRDWDELTRPGLRQLEFHEVLDRARTDGDLLTPLLAAPSPPPRPVNLDEYRAKRDAHKTPEPFGGAASAGDPIFVIQEHHARRLHYDFRLEHDGVLASWAVPKNLPDDPAVNHLAVRTEDHPMDYAAFEGSIPKGEYGGGDVTIWDHGTYELEKWRKDEVIVTLHGERLRGLRYALIRTGEKNWLAHLTKDTSAPVTKASAAAPDPMLPTESPIDRLSVEEWAFEGKWDGYRIIATVRGGALSLRTRSGRVVTGDFPEFESLAHDLDGMDVVLDGEAVVLDPNGVPSFHLMAGGDTRAGAVQLYLFDVLELNGVDLTRRPWTVRREVLEGLAPLLDSDDAIAVPPLVEASSGAVAAAVSAEFGWEGIVAKRRDSPYLPGQRVRAWLKHKNWRDLQVAIGGWKPGKGSRANRIGSVLVGLPAETGLVYLGSVGSGFSDRDLDALAERLEPLRMKRSPFTAPIDDPDARDAVWVLPQVVGDVRYSSLRRGGHLRQPSWRGFREDLLPGDLPGESDIPWEGPDE